MSVEFRQRKPGEYLKILQASQMAGNPSGDCDYYGGCLGRLSGSLMSTSQPRSLLSGHQPAQGVVPTVTEDTMTRQLTAINAGRHEP